MRAEIEVAVSMVVQKFRDVSKVVSLEKMIAPFAAGALGRYAEVSICLSPPNACDDHGSDSRGIIALTFGVRLLLIGVSPVNEESPMNIVVEGPDNSGKSTLIKVLARDLNYKVVPSPGPCRSELDFIERYQHLRRVNNTIFDRHACVSEVIYGPLCGRGEAFINPLVLTAFYNDPPILIYCRGRDLAEHKVRKGVDTPEHLEAVYRNHAAICNRYEEWAKMCADVWYDVRDHLAQPGGNVYQAVASSTVYLRKLIRFIIWERENGIVRPLPGHRRVPPKVRPGIQGQATSVTTVDRQIPREVHSGGTQRVSASG